MGNTKRSQMAASRSKDGGLGEQGNEPVSWGARRNWCDIWMVCVWGHGRSKSWVSSRLESGIHAARRHSSWARIRQNGRNRRGRASLPDDSDQW